MNDAERDVALKNVLEMTTRMHEALIVAKVPDRVQRLERFESQAKLVTAAAWAAIVAAWVKVWDQ